MPLSVLLHQSEVLAKVSHKWCVIGARRPAAKPLSGGSGAAAAAVRQIRPGPAHHRQARHVYSLYPRAHAQHIDIRKVMRDGVRHAVVKDASLQR